MIKQNEKSNLLQTHLSINELSEILKIPVNEIVKYFFMQGKIVNINQVLDKDLIKEIANNFKKEIEFAEKEDRKINIEINKEKLTKRAPIVTIMGHVDHGKTSLLDAIRLTNVVSKESGGITQNIGAYQVNYNNELITFIDTPGHAAFAQMRARGSKVTDIIIIVVAANDGVMPQTREAIDHAKLAKVPIIIAINKIDLPDKNIERINADLAKLNILSEEWGGENIFVEVSAKDKTGIDKLLETILLLADLEEYKADPTSLAFGSVIESKLDKNCGVCASLLIEGGTLKVGDFIAIGASYGKIRLMRNDLGKNIQKALPSTPVEIIGLSEVPCAGEKFIVFSTLKEARDFALENKLVQVKENRCNFVNMDLKDFNDKNEESKSLNIIIKSNSDGSSEALKTAIEKIKNEEVNVNIIRSQAGLINEDDLLLAVAANAIIYGFNVEPSNNLLKEAKELNIEIRNHDVIYRIIDEVEEMASGMLKPIYQKERIGSVEVRKIFIASKVGNIAGSYVVDGSIKKNSIVELIRKNKIIYEGKVKSLKRMSNDVNEVKTGFECGIILDKFDSYQEGDILEVYELKQIKRKIGDK